MALTKLGSVKAVTQVLVTSADLASEVTGTLPVGNGGTGQSSYTNGQLLIGQTSGNTLAKAVLSGDVTMDQTGAVAIGAGKVTNTMLAGSIAASKLVGTDIASVGTITAGTWNGTTIAVANGGTGQTTAANAINALLPSQTGNSGEYLTTDGSVASWAPVSASLIVSTSAITSGTATRLLYETSGNVLGEISGATSDGTNVTFGDGNARMTSPWITTGLDDSVGNREIAFTATSSAVNWLTVTNAASGGNVIVGTDGSNTAVPLYLYPKGGSYPNGPQVFIRHGVRYDQPEWSWPSPLNGYGIHQNSGGGWMSINANNIALGAGGAQGGAAAHVCMLANTLLSWTGSTTTPIDDGSTSTYLIVGRRAAGDLRLGGIDVDLNSSIVAQTLSVQGALTGGTTNQAGKDFTIDCSRGKGTGAGGSFIVRTAAAGSSGSTLNSLANALTIDSAKLATFTGAVTLAGVLTAGSGPTTVTDPTGKVLSAALNTVGVAQGGTGATTLTGLLQGNGASAVTAISNSSTVGQCLRVTGTSTYAWGALDLADTDAVTGTLPAGNGGTGNAFFAVSGPASSTKTFTFPNSSSTVAVLGTAQTFTAVQTYSAARIGTPVALSDGANIATNAALGNYFRVTLGGNRTLDAPTNAVDGQQIVYEFIQDGTGSRTLTLASGTGGFILGTDITSTTLTTTASKTDYMTCVYNSTAQRWRVVGFVKGF